MKKTYIHPSINISNLDTGSCILETSTLVPQGGEKDENWEGEAKPMNNEYDYLW